MSLCNLTITEAHHKLKNKEISSTELTAATLDEIDKKDSDIKAFLSITKEEALNQAKIADKRIQDNDIHFLTGIPYSIKDPICTKGIRTTAGSNMLKEFIPPYTATAISKLEKTGAVMLGKTNCDAYGHGSSTENSDFQVTKNPWDKDYVAGGSSGGSAAAVAANMGLFSIGEDTGGSIRQPASFCGVTGLKVSYGRISRYGVISYASSFDTLGPITKTAEDAAIVLETIAGYDEMDPTTLPNKVPKYHDKLDVDLKNITIGLPQECFGDGLESTVKESIDEAINSFKKAGATIKNISLPTTSYLIPIYYLLTCAETSSNLSRLDGMHFGHSNRDVKDINELYLKSRAEGFGPETKRRIMLGTYTLSAGYYDAYYKQAQKARTLVIEDYNKAFQEVDVILTPTSPFPPFKAGEKENDPLSMYLADVYTVAPSLAGIPCISIPCGFTNNLPIGMQLTVPSFEEERVLKIAHGFQNITEWHVGTTD